MTANESQSTGRSGGARKSRRARVEAEIIDDLDEAFELEFGEDRLDMLVEQLSGTSEGDDNFRRTYSLETIRIVCSRPVRRTICLGMAAQLPLKSRDVLSISGCLQSCDTHAGST